MKNNDGSALTKKQIFGYAMGDLGGCMTFAIMGSFLLPYYTEAAGISSGAVAVMFLVLKIWDAINDPMMGAIMDKMFARTHHENGKFRPWMMRATPLLFITAVLMFTMPSITSGMSSLVVAYVTYLLYEASYTMFNIPYGSLLSGMAGTEGERATLSSARGFGSMIGNLLPMALFPVIISATSANPKMGYGLGVALCAAIGLVACLFSCKCTSENKSAKIDLPDEASEDIKFSDILVVIKKEPCFCGHQPGGAWSHNFAIYRRNSWRIYVPRRARRTPPHGHHYHPQHGTQLCSAHACAETH